MQKKELIAHLADQLDCPQTQADVMLKTVFETIQNCLGKGDELMIPGFGKFAVKHQQARTGRNPATGKELKIPAKVVPVFRASSTLKEWVSKKNKPKATSKQK